jgi:uncharacterized protein YbcI
MESVSRRSRTRSSRSSPSTTDAVRRRTYSFDNYLVTVLEDILTTVERTLVERGEEDLVRQVRLTFEDATAERFTSAVSEIAGREVVGYHSQVTFNPSIGFEIFVLAE